ncbi:MAG: glucuronate isomerase, partial [Clostridia bacterium]|nr:glucuronate isomerase [Clostridia bacterium]
MKTFMDQDFLLNTQAAKTLYHEAAKDCPIIDYHCHLSPREIYEDIRYDNITQVWLGGDHYKWRLMRSAGVPEKYVTGDAPDYEKFLKYAEVLGKAIGNPLYHWSHLELRRFFGYDGILNKDTAPEVWRIANEKLHSKSTRLPLMAILPSARAPSLCMVATMLCTLNFLYLASLTSASTSPMGSLPPLIRRILAVRTLE